MNKAVKYFFIAVFSSFVLTGCYTVVWQPNEELPTKENSDKNENVFYDTNNFGVFSPYYNSPWWLNPDNEFLIDDINGLTEVDNSVDEISTVTEITRGKLPLPIQPIILVTPPHKFFDDGKIYVSTTKMRKKVKNANTIKPRKETKNNNKLRNDNGGRKIRKGRRR